MSRAGTRTFDDPDRYRTLFRGADIDLVFTAPGEFKARLTWAELPNLSIWGTQENIARIASISFEPSRDFISFPASADSGLIWNGIDLQPNEIVFHRPGSRAYDRGDRAGGWRFISIDPSHLQAVGHAIAGRNWTRPACDLILQPSLRSVTRLRSLHAKACKLAESKPQMLLHREVGRAIEQELIRVLIDCLTTRDSRRTATLSRHIRMMEAFEDASAANIERDVDLPRLCEAIGVPQRTLRLYCNRLLGMGPHRYLRLRRLNMVRAALQHANPATCRVAEIAQRYRFSELGRFSAAYRAVFGEMPSETLRRHRMAA